MRASHAQAASGIFAEHRCCFWPDRPTLKLSRKISKTKFLRHGLHAPVGLLRLFKWAQQAPSDLLYRWLSALAESCAVPVRMDQPNERLTDVLATPVRTIFSVCDEHAVGL